MTSVLSDLLRQHSVRLFRDGAALVNAELVDENGSTVPAGPVGGAWQRLAVTEQHQQQTEWCWDATTVSIHGFYDPDSTWTQCQFANAKLGRTDCCTNGSSNACNQPNWSDQALDLLGNFVRTQNGTMVIGDVQTQIDAGRPISVATYWSGGGGHNPAVVGYRTDPAGDWLAIVDPWYGSSDVLHSVFSTAYQGSGSWGYSFLTKSAVMRVGALTTRSGGTATVVSRDSHALDVFASDANGAICTAALWEAGGPTSWQGWWPLNGGRAAPGAPVTAVSRSTDKLDVFVVGTDNRVWTAAWEPGNVDGWHGWWTIGDLQVPQGSAVSAVSRSADKLDIFATDVNGVIQTAAWEPGNADGWHGWWPLNGGRAAPGAPVTAVSRSTDKLDVFVVGTDNRVWTAAWEPGNVDGWHGWWTISDLQVPQGSAVSAVSRSADKLDIFATDVNGVIQTAAWEPGNADGWHGWWPLNGGRAAPGAPVTAVSRSTDKLDVFVVGTDNRVWTAAWEPGNADGWHGWWTITDLHADPGTTISPAARTADSIDVVFAGQDGAVYTCRWDAGIAAGGWRG